MMQYINYHLNRVERGLLDKVIVADATVLSIERKMKSVGWLLGHPLHFKSVARKRQEAAFERLGAIIEGVRLNFEIAYNGPQDVLRSVAGCGPISAHIARLNM